MGIQMIPVVQNFVLSQQSVSDKLRLSTELFRHSGLENGTGCTMTALRTSHFAKPVLQL